MSYWTTSRTVQRRRAVDPDDIARVSVDLLDGEGPRGLTVRAVAERCGVSPSGLYSRISGVDDLFDLALDHALGQDAQVTEQVGRDDPDLTELLVAYFRHLAEHRWACQVLAERTPRGPNYLRVSELMCRLLENAGAVDPLGTAYSLSNFVIGSALTAPMTGSERELDVDADAAPVYARLRSTHDATAEQLLRRGLVSLLHTR